MASFLIQVSTRHRDWFREATDTALRECLNQPDLEKRKDLLFASSKAVAVEHTGGVDIGVVCNGEDDAESWEDVREFLDGQ